MSCLERPPLNYDQFWLVAMVVTVNRLTVYENWLDGNIKRIKYLNILINISLIYRSIPMYITSQGPVTIVV